MPSLVEGLTLRDSGGDGVNVGPETPPQGGPQYCEDVTLRNVWLDNNYRNGLALISVKNFLADGLVISNTNGTRPGAGVDIEPVKRKNMYVTDIVFRNLRTVNNEHNAIGVNLGNYRGQRVGGDISILIENWYALVSEAGAGLHVYGIADDSGVGVIKVRSALVHRPAGAVSAAGCGLLASDKRREVPVVCEEVSWLGAAPMWVRSNHPARTAVSGGVVWRDCVLATEEDGPWLTTDTLKPDGSIADLSGNLTVISPNEPTTSLAPATSGVSVDVTWLASPPRCVVLARAATRQVKAGAVGRIRVGRRLIGRSRDLSVPLAVRYTMGGTAVEGQDYNIVSGVAVIAPGEDEVEIPIRTKPSGVGKTVEVSVAASRLFDCRGATAAMTRFTLV